MKKTNDNGHEKAIHTRKENPIKKRSAQKEETRRRIMEAGRKMFAEKGFANTNVADIAKDIHMALGTVYYHFRDKKSLLLELLGEVFNELFRVTEPWTATPETHAELFQAFVQKTANTIFENLDMGRIIRNEEYNPDPDIRGLIRGAFLKFYDHVEQGLIHGMELGVVRKLDPRLVGIMAVGMIKETVYHLLDHEEDLDLEPLISEVTNQWNYGINAAPEKAVP